MSESQENSKKVDEVSVEVGIGVWFWDYVLRKLEISKMGRMLDKALPEVFQISICTVEPNYPSLEEIQDIVREHWGIKGSFQVESIHLMEKTYVSVERILNLNMPLLQKNKLLLRYNNLSKRLNTEGRTQGESKDKEE